MNSRRNHTTPTGSTHITREQRQQMLKDQRRHALLHSEASRLMNITRVASAQNFVPDWMYAMAAWSIEHQVVMMPHSEALARYPEFFAAMAAGWRGDMVSVEMWAYANEPS